MIKITDNARDQVKKVMTTENHPEGAFVRVGVQSGGCSGLMYQLDFDTELKETDKSI